MNVAAMSANTHLDAIVQRLSSADSGKTLSWWSITFGIGPRWSFANFFLLDVKIKAEAATQLRDNLETYISGAYPAFLKRLIPIFLNCLKGPPVFISTSPEQVF
jgi:hypothetical protein